MRKQVVATTGSVHADNEPERAHPARLNACNGVLDDDGSGRRHVQTARGFEEHVWLWLARQIEPFEFDAVDAHREQRFEFLPQPRFGAALRLAEITAVPMPAACTSRTSRTELGNGSTPTRSISAMNARFLRFATPQTEATSGASELSPCGR